jgi:hypothetical protein
MTEFKWKILQTTSVDNSLKSVHYLVTATDEGKIVESQGHADVDRKIVIPFEQIKELDIINCLKEMYMQDDPKSLKSRLEEQLNYLKNEVNTDFPWAKQVFTPNLG